MPKRHVFKSTTYIYKFVTWIIIKILYIFESLRIKISGNRMAKITPMLIEKYSVEWDEENGCNDDDFENTSSYYGNLIHENIHFRKAVIVHKIKIKND